MAQETQAAAAVLIEGLVKRYASAQPPAVDGLSLRMEHGEIYGLLGPNGAGKTTTVKILAGLIFADGGSISFPAFGRRPVLGAVLEGSRNLYWRLSPWENIRYFGELKGVPLSRLRRQSDELLEMFDLGPKRNVAAQTLSRGMQQKLAIVLALLGDPELLLLDEPTLGLDVESSIAIQALLQKLCAERGLSILITTHQMDIAENICTRVGIVQRGKLAVEKSVAELKDLLRRQDYLLRFDASRLDAVAAALSAFRIEILADPRQGQSSLRVGLNAPRDVYALMDALRAADAELLDFRQEEPTLGDVFLSYTRGQAGGGTAS